MRLAKFVLALLGATALSGCVWYPDGHVSGEGTVVIGSDGSSGGPPPGRGWRR